MINLNFEEKFEKLSKKLLCADSSKFSESFAIQVNMSDEDCGGIFYIANINDVFSVEPYDYHDHTAMITASADDVLKVLTGKLSLDNGIKSGRFTVKGNPEHIRIVAAAFPKPAKKATTKKTKKAK